MGIQGISVLVAPLVFSHFADKSRGGPHSIIFISVLIVAASFVALSLFNGFITLAIILFTFGVFFTPLFSLFDGLALSMGENQNKKTPFAHERVWGSIGFVVSAFLFSWLVEYASLSYRFLMALAAGCSVVLALYFYIKKDVLHYPKAQLSQSRLPSKEAVRQLLKPAVSFFVLATFCIACAMSSFYIFFPLYLEQLNISKRYIGPIINIGVIAETLLFFCAPWLKRTIGVPWLLVIGTISVTLRLLLLAYTHSVPVTIISQVFHAPIILVLSLLASEYLNKVAEARYRYSILGIQQLLSGGIARFVGGVGFGYAAVVLQNFIDMPEISLVFLCSGVVGILGIVFSFYFKSKAATQ